MIIPTHREEQALSEEAQALQTEIRRLQTIVDNLHQDSATDFVMSLGSPAPGSVIGPDYRGPRVKRTTVDGEVIPWVVVADIARGFVLYAVQPLQVRPGTGDIWLDIKCGKVTVEYEGGPADLKARLREVASQRDKSQDCVAPRGRVPLPNGAVFSVGGGAGEGAKP